MVSALPPTEPAQAHDDIRDRPFAGKRFNCQGTWYDGTPCALGDRLQLMG